MCLILPTFVSVNLGMYELYVAQMPRPFHPARGSSMRPSTPRVENGIGYGRRKTVNFFVFGSNINNESEVVPVTINRIFAESEGIELIHPQEIGIFGAAGFLSSARELSSGQFPVTEFFGLGIQLSKMTAPGGEPDCSVGAEIDSVGETQRRRQRVVFELLGLRIEHIQFVLRPVDLRHGHPDRAIHRANSSRIAA